MTSQYTDQDAAPATRSPTASGKTLCYNLPVLQNVLEDNGARAMYLFPTKALSAENGGAPTYGTGLTRAIGPDGKEYYVQASSAGGIQPFRPTRSG